MEVLREQVAAAIQGALPVIPPQDNGFEVGDILLVNRSQNPARGSRMSDEWFSPLNQNIRDFDIEYTPPPPSTATGVTSIALTKKNSLDAGIKAKLTGLFGLKSLFARSEDESITIELIDKTLTNGRTGLNKDVFFDDRKMDPMFQHPMNKESWISDGCGLVAFVEQSWSGDIQFKDSSGSAVSLGMVLWHPSLHRFHLQRALISILIRVRLDASKPAAWRLSGSRSPFSNLRWWRNSYTRGAP